MQIEVIGKKSCKDLRNNAAEGWLGWAGLSASLSEHDQWSACLTGCAHGVPWCDGGDVRLSMIYGEQSALELQQESLNLD